MPLAGGCYWWDLESVLEDALPWNLMGDVDIIYICFITLTLLYFTAHVPTKICWLSFRNHWQMADFNSKCGDLDKC